MVMGLVNGLCHHPAVGENDLGSLLGLIQELNSIRMTLVQSNLVGTFNSPLMLQAALALFPMSYQCKYHDWLQDFHPDDQPSLETLLIFRKRQARTLSRSISIALPVVPKSMTKRTVQHAVQDVDHEPEALGFSSKSPSFQLDGLIEEVSLSNVEDNSDNEQDRVQPMEVDILHKFNSLRKATRTFAFVMLFISRCKATIVLSPRRKLEAVQLLDCSISWPGLKTVKFKKLSRLPTLTPAQLQLSEDRIICASQKFADSETYTALKQDSKLRPSNPLRKLCLFLDDNGIIRIKSRLSTSENLAYNVRFPIYVPKKSPLAVGIFWDIHRDNLHSAGHQPQVSRQTWTRIFQEAHTDLPKMQITLAKDKPAVDGPTPELQSCFRSALPLLDYYVGCGWPISDEAKARSPTSLQASYSLYLRCYQGSCL
jgi:hypothetical protein